MRGVLRYSGTPRRHSLGCRVGLPQPRACARQGPRSPDLAPHGPTTCTLHLASRISHVALRTYLHHQSRATTHSHSHVPKDRAVRTGTRLAGYPHGPPRPQPFLSPRLPCALSRWGCCGFTRNADSARALGEGARPSTLEHGTAAGGALGMPLLQRAGVTRGAAAACRNGQRASYEQRHKRPALRARATAHLACQ
jgi:hypothetical protein